MDTWSTSEPFPWLSDGSLPSADISDAGSPTTPTSDLGAESHYFLPPFFYPGGDENVCGGYTVADTPGPESNFFADFGLSSPSQITTIQGFDSPLDTNTVDTGVLIAGSSDQDMAGSHRRQPIPGDKRSAAKKEGNQRKPSAKLRTTPIASKNGRRASAKSQDSDERQASRSCHNQVERAYRNRLNAQFQRLLAVLESVATREGDGFKAEDPVVPFSKARVLDLAVRTLRDMKTENQELVGKVEQLKSEWHMSRAAALGLA